MRGYPSCDTLVVERECTVNGEKIIGKNSDRDVTESQPLIAFPACEHKKGDMLKCTYIEIEQVERTYAMIGSKPWWIWGFEHGVNEYGVAIGNEADWSNIDTSSEDGLLGMDLLRLGLERGKNARESLNVITTLLEKYGQGGPCAYGATREDFSYHNSFIITDPHETWLLETVDREWVARKISKYHCISNVYTIEDDYDMTSKNIKQFAIDNGLFRPGDESFNFAKSFTLLQSDVLSGYARYKRMKKLLSGMEGAVSVEKVAGILRDHFDGEIIHADWGPSCAQGGLSVCMHGCDPQACQTAATMIVQFHKTEYKELLFTYWGSMCPPCSSFLIPFYNTGFIPPELATGTNKYSNESFWWKVNKMCVLIESDYNRYIHHINDVRPEMEKGFRDEAREVEKEALEFLEQNRNEDAKRILNDFTKRCFEKVSTTVDEITRKIEIEQRSSFSDISRKNYLLKYIKKTDMDVNLK